MPTGEGALSGEINATSIWSVAPWARDGCYQWSGFSSPQSKPGDYSRSGSHTRPSQTFLVAVTSICDLSQLAKQTSLHIECKHSYFFINLISGVCSAAESYVKIKHCFQKFFFFLRGIFANVWFVLWNYIFPSSVILSLTGQRTFIETYSQLHECRICCVESDPEMMFLKNELEIRWKKVISCAVISFKGQVSPGQCFDYSASRWKLYPSISIFSYSQRTLPRSSQPSWLTPKQNFHFPHRNALIEFRGRLCFA